LQSILVVPFRFFHQYAWSFDNAGSNVDLHVTHSIIAQNVRYLAAARHVVVSQHAARRIRERGIRLADIISGAANGEVIEDYPTYHGGPALLMLQWDSSGSPLHVVWGIEYGTMEPAVVVTAYRPNPLRWSADFRIRAP
jgi:hypothetical protein